MTQEFRLARSGRIERDRVLGFRFDGVSYTGHPGDTLASALLANGVHLVARSFKYHRPRGILSAGVEEPNALVTLGEGAWREPNVRATEAELFEGLVAQSQNRWPSLRIDVGALAGLFAKLLPAGFYYKTFMWPGGVVARRLRETHSPHGRPGPLSRTPRSRALRDPPCPLRSPGRRRGSRGAERGGGGGPVGGPRDPGGHAERARREPAGPPGRDRRQGGKRMGCGRDACAGRSRERRGADANDDRRLLRLQLSRRAATPPRPSACRRTRGRGAAAPVAHPRETGRARHGRGRTAAGLCRQ